MATHSFPFSEIAGAIAGIVSGLAFLPYVLAIRRGETTPNRATWLIWTIIGWLTLVSYYQLGADSTKWFALSYAVFHTVIFIMSITRGEGGWSIFDLSCIMIAVFGLILWRFTDSALIGLACFIVADFVAALPTIRKCRVRPFTENRWAWAISAGGAGINLLAIDQMKIGIIVYPVYMFAVLSLIAFFAWRPVLKQRPGWRIQ